MGPGRRSTGTRSAGKGAAAAATPRWRGPRELAVCLVLLVVVLALYWPVRENAFVNFDDLATIADNPHVRGGVTSEAVEWAFSRSYLANWHPLTWISYMVDFELWGEDVGRHHLVNAVLHALNTVLLFLALRALTGHLWPAALAAALFGLHPLRVESVAWATERKDVLSGFFWMLTLLAYATYARRGGALRYLLVVASLALGLMAKPMLVSLPLVLLLLDYWPLSRLRPDRQRVRQVLLEKIPLLALVAGASVITFLSQQSGGALSKIPMIPRLANALIATTAYLWKTIWPSRLAVFYPHPIELHPHLDAWWIGMIALSGTLLAGTTWWAWRSRDRRPYLLVGWGWYLITLVPVVGIVQVGRQALADRYTYIPLIGVYLALCWGMRDLLAGRRSLRTAAAGAAAVALIVLMVLTRRQITYWKDSATLFEQTLRVTRSNYMAHNNLGTALARSGDRAGSRLHYEQALRIRPDYADALANLGVVLYEEKDLAGAERYLERAIAAQSDHANAQYNLGRTLLARDDLEAATAQFRRALAIDPEHVEALTNLGVTLARRGDLDGARSQFFAALRLRPGHDSALRNASRLAKAYADGGRLPEAEATAREALRYAQASGRADLAQRLDEQARAFRR